MENEPIADKSRLEIEHAEMKAALNKIGMLGMSELAYTNEFTERVMNIVYWALKDME